MLGERSDDLAAAEMVDLQMMERCQEQDGVPESACDLDLSREMLDGPRDPLCGALGKSVWEPNPVPNPLLGRDLGPNVIDPLDLRDDEDRGELDEMANLAVFRPGAYRGRGCGVLSRSGARVVAMDDVGGLAGIQRLLNRNKSLELELQRYKGMNSNSMAATPVCGVEGNQQLVEQVRSKGGTHTARCNASEEKVQDSAGDDFVSKPVGDGRESELDFLPPVAGVGLDKYIAAALSASKGVNKGKNSGGGKEVQNRMTRSGPGADSVDPFPPLSRLIAGSKGLEGISASSRNSPAADQNNLHGASDIAGLVQAIADPIILQGARDIAGLMQAAADGGVSKFSWRDLLRSNKPENVCVDLHYVKPSIIDGEECAIFSLEEEAENLMQWQNTLLCYVVGKSPSYYQFLKAMQRQWNPPGGLEMFSRENGIFFCKFGNEGDMKKVIKDGPWYMDGKLVVVKIFSGETNCEEEMLSSIPIWVKLPCLPVQWWSIEGVSKVISPLGHPLYFDLTSASKSRIAYARCCVEVAMEKNLPSSVLCVGGDKIKKRQTITYDWVPKRCSACKEFGHVVAECGGGQPKNQQEGKGIWINNKKIGKGRQIYLPKEKNQTIEVEGELETNTQKDENVAEKKNQILKKGVALGAIYKTNMLKSRMETIKASSTNQFQLLADSEADTTGDKLDGGNKGNHIYFCSDDEKDNVEVDDLTTWNEDQMQNSVEAEKINNVEEMESSAVPLVIVSCPSIIGVDAEIVMGVSADEDPRELEARGSGKEMQNELPTNLGNIFEEGSNQENKESDNEDEESASESEDEDAIRGDGKHPAEFGMPPSLTVSNPKYLGEIEVSIESKKVKKKTTPAPVRPVGSRTTRHSFRMG